MFLSDYIDVGLIKEVVTLGYFLYINGVEMKNTLENSGGDFSFSEFASSEGFTFLKAMSDILINSLIEITIVLHKLFYCISFRAN